MLKIINKKIPDGVTHIGIISDIHANFPALEAVIKDAKDVDIWLCLGDLVGYYTEPNEVCEFIRQKNMICILGNHDAYVTGSLEPKHSNTAKYRMEWTRSILSAENMVYLSSLPLGIELNINSAVLNKIIAFHATPQNIEKYYYKKEDWAEVNLKQNELMVVGHTHIPHISKCDQGKIINPGSVGQPRNWRPGAYYAVCNIENGIYELRRVDYDWVKYQKHLEEQEVLSEMINMLSRYKEVI